MKVYVHRGYLCLKDKLYKHTQQIILYTFSLLGDRILKERGGILFSPYPSKKERTKEFFSQTALNFLQNGLFFYRTVSKYIFLSSVRTADFRYERPKTGSDNIISVLGGAALRAFKPIALYFLPLKILFCVCLAHAGQRGLTIPAAAGVALETDSITPLEIGERVPDGFWKYKHLVYGKGDTIRKSLDEYQGKILVLDFWASWCSSCIIRFPEVQALQDTFLNKIHFLLVNSMETRDRYANVKRVFDRYGNRLLKDIRLPGLIHDTYLKSLFPHRAVPHYVWIDERGYVVAKTYSTFVNAEQIRMLLEEAERVESLMKKKP